MLDETIIQLLEPTILAYIQKEVEERIKEVENEPIDINLTQASVLVGRSKNTLRDILYRNRKEIEATRYNPKGFVIFGDGGMWRIGKHELLDWWKSNRYKTAG